MTSPFNAKVKYTIFLFLLFFISFSFGPLNTNSSAEIISDDFNSATLNTSLWQFINPLDDGSVSMTGSQVSISVPDGTSHDVWSDGNFVPRIVQSVDDTDFEIEVKFDSLLSERYQMEGVLVHQDDLKFLRFDFYSDGSSTWIHCASFTDGQPTRIYRSVISSGAPLYMRIKRAADLWTQAYSTDDSVWTELPEFTFAMQMNTIGVFAGNAGTDPAFGALADYFLNISDFIAPSITVQPVDQSVTEGQSATFSVTATGTAPLSYQWQKDGVNISEATGNSYTTPETTLDDDGAQFTCTVTNGYGSVVSNSATLTVNITGDVPSITSQPVDQSVTEGQSATFSVTAIGTTPLSYQWQKDGVDISGATGASYTTPATTLSDDGALFTCTVTNDYGSVDSDSATLTVSAAGSAPTITVQPTDQSVTEGQSATFSVTAIGTTPLTYQWQKDGVDISGATGASYTTPATTLSDDGALFTCTVTNDYGSVDSDSATLTVNAAGSTPSITTQPVDQTVNEGFTATFSITATGTDPLGYQWQKDSVDISGATGTSYTTPATTLDDDGAQFTCTVTNDYGSVSSDSATLIVLPASAEIISDDFNAASLDTSLWQFINPLDDGSVAMTGSQVSISVPGGTSHDVWSDGNFAPRIVQYVDDTDFEIEVKFDSLLSERYQMEGVLVHQDDLKFLRFDFYSDGSSTWIHCASFTDGQPTRIYRSVISSGAPLYMRVKRAADLWTQSFSTDGSSWTEFPAFTFSMQMHTIGIFAGNAGPSPAFIMLADYFLNISGYTAPTITTQPDDQSVTEGQSATFSVTATGTAPLSYQWQKDGADISGATAASYTTPATTLADDGAQFVCTVTNDYGSDTSNPATLTVSTAGSAPTITVQPEDQGVTEGQSATFSVTATGTAPLSYQWQKDGADISGATAASYTTPTTTLPDDGVQFVCTVTNDYGSDTSNPATLTVSTAGSAPTITVQPEDQSVFEGQSATFTVTATGTNPLGYQWQKDGVDISGAISTSYTTPATTLADDGAQFVCTVTNDYGSDTSNSANLTVSTASSAPTITVQPVNQSVVEGQSATFSVTATGADPLSYQWQKDGVNISGATGASYNTPASSLADNGAQFTCIVTNDYGSVSSDSAILYVLSDTGEIASDDFNAASLNTSLWQFINPLDDGSVDMTGSQVSISVPAGVSHDVWSDGNFAPRIVQHVDDTDFEIEVKFDSLLSERYQLEGVLVHQDDLNFLRFDFYTDGSSTRIHCASFTDGEPTRIHRSIISSGAPLYMRVKRAADLWTQSYSTDGSTWTEIPEFTFAMQMNTIGIFAGNAGPNPSFSALADYFLNISDFIAPSITLQPVDQSVTEGQSATFSVTATGTAPLSYQWQKDGVDISAATGSSYTTPAATLADDGAQFSCTVTNDYGSASSDPATLTVNAAGSSPSITVQPENQSVTEGQSATFSITAIGTAPLSYKWQKEGADISGATGASYTTPATTLADDGAQFSCTVTNDYGSVVSNSATLTVNTTGSAPSITVQPVDQSVTEGQSASFSVTATGNAPLSYQWQKDGADISGATSSSYTTPATTLADDGAQFLCIVTNDYGSASSYPATLTVNAAGSAPSISTQPVDQSVVEGQSATFSVTASGTAPLSYQWQKDGSDISGATSTSYTTPATTLADDGTQFNCIVTNDYGSVSSDPATLTVMDSSTFFDFWYAEDQGDRTYYQAFGQIGIPQRWINVLGNVDDADGVDSLTFTLNGGSENTLTIGPNGRRLQSTGDFNVEIEFTELLSSPEINEIVITATDSLGNPSQVTVNVEYFDDNIWPDTYSVDWSEVQNIDDASQIVDGLWTLENGSVRTVIPGYDRLIAIGDVLWDDYEITVPVTINGLLSGSNDSGVGILLRWDGHYAWTSSQPTYGWYPMGALGWYRYQGGRESLRMIGGESDLDIEDTSGKTLNFGVPYIFKMRVQTISDVGSVYRLKVWEQGQTEPADWDLMGEEDLTSPLNGSLLLLSHNADTSFGSVSVTPLSGDLPPIITTQPVDQSVNEGQSATFSVTATGATLLSYQWQKDGVDIDGETSASYTTPDATLDDDGAQFSCTVTNDYGSVASDPATLIVLSISDVIVSDDFNTGSLDTDLWQFIDPLGDGSVAMTGSQVSISVPAGTNHDVWSDGNLAPRIIQYVGNIDFEIEVKFDSDLSEAYQLEGVLVEQDDDSFLRFDFYTDGSLTRIHCASFTNGQSTRIYKYVISSGAPRYMRVKREGDTWIQSYSYDGTTWNVLPSFTFSMQMNDIGLFSGNAGSNPDFIALFDYFMDISSPTN